MFIPPDAFGGATPERTMARQMKCATQRLRRFPPALRRSLFCRAFFTYVASHVVLGQLMNASPRLNTADGGSAATSDGASESQRVVSDYDTLLDFLAANPVRDGDAWLRALAAGSPRLATRVAAVRLAYGTDEAGCGFEWSNLRRLAEEEMREGNLAVMRDWASSLVPRTE